MQARSGELAAADPPVYWPERKYTYGTAEAFNTVRWQRCLALAPGPPLHARRFNKPHSRYHTTCLYT